MLVSLTSKIVAGCMVALLLIGLGAWVIHPTWFIRPSPAAKVQAQVSAAVPVVQARAAAAAGQAEAQTRAANTATEQRTETHVAKIRAAGAAHPASSDVPDREFFDGVCESKLYAGNPDCRGFGGQPEGDHPAAGPRKLRAR